MIHTYNKAPQMLRQNNHKFKVNLGYVMRPCLIKINLSFFREFRASLRMKLSGRMLAYYSMGPWLPSPALKKSFLRELSHTLF